MKASRSGEGMDEGASVLVVPEDSVPFPLLVIEVV